MKSKFSRFGGETGPAIDQTDGDSMDSTDDFTNEPDTHADAGATPPQNGHHDDESLDWGEGTSYTPKIREDALLSIQPGDDVRVVLLSEKPSGFCAAHYIKGASENERGDWVACCARQVDKADLDRQWPDLCVICRYAAEVADEGWDAPIGAARFRMAQAVGVYEEQGIVRQRWHFGSRILYQLHRLSPTEWPHHRDLHIIRSDDGYSYQVRIPETAWWRDRGLTPDDLPLDIPTNERLEALRSDPDDRYSDRLEERLREVLDNN